MVSVTSSRVSCHMGSQTDPAPHRLHTKSPPFGAGDPTEGHAHRTNSPDDSILGTIPLLKTGQMYIVPHPHSGEMPHLVKSLLLQPSKPGEAPPSQLTSSSVGIRMESILPAYHPFTSESNFEQAELFIKDNCTDRHINKQLKLVINAANHDKNAPPMDFKNAKEMHRLLRSSLVYDAAGEVCSHYIFLAKG